jgi:hypothetical protein
MWIVGFFLYVAVVYPLLIGLIAWRSAAFRQLLLSGPYRVVGAGLAMAGILSYALFAGLVWAVLRNAA